LPCASPDWGAEASAFYRQARLTKPKSQDYRNCTGKEGTKGLIGGGHKTGHSRAGERWPVSRETLQSMLRLPSPLFSEHPAFVSATWDACGRGWVCRKCVGLHRERLTDFRPRTFSGNPPRESQAPPWQIRIRASLQSQASVKSWEILGRGHKASGEFECNLLTEVMRHSPQMAKGWGS
jgi:hypothetical protein